VGQIKRPKWANTTCQTQCLTRKRSSGKIENYHTLLAATLVAPRQNRVLPLMPEFITPQDCERNAAKRWLKLHGGRLRELSHPSSTQSDH
jgi:hypothetical protein